jgi:hypothetical protein
MKISWEGIRLSTCLLNLPDPPPPHFISLPLTPLANALQRRSDLGIPRY